MIIIVTILGRAQISKKLVGSAKFRNREHENKTGGGALHLHVIPTVREPGTG